MFPFSRFETLPRLLSATLKGPRSWGMSAFDAPAEEPGTAQLSSFQKAPMPGRDLSRV